MNSYELEQKKLLLDFLNIHCFENWKILPSKRPRDMYVNSLEMMVSPICNTKCTYCYIKNYSNELYPCNYDEHTLIDNCDKLMNWIYLNRYYPDRIEIFSGEFFNLPFWKKYLNTIIKYLDLMEEGTNVSIVIPTNGTFLFNDNKTKEISEYIDNLRNKNYYIFLSLSIDGKYLDNDTRALRNGKKYDDDFYDKAFKFANYHNLNFHPMIGCKGIDKWIDNFDWYIQNMQKYFNISKKEAFNRIYLLEVRNPDWTNSELKYFYKFLNHLLDNIFEGCESSYEKFLCFKNQGLNIFSQIISCVGRGLGCSFQSTFDVRMGDLALVQCHRTSYDELLAGYLLIDNDKLDINIKNVNSYIFSNSFDFKYTNNCVDCPISNLCIGPCVGCNYEINKDLYTMVPTVCKLEIVKILTIIERLDNEGILDYIIEVTCGTNEFKPKAKQIESIREYLKIKKLEGVKYDI